MASDPDPTSRPDRDVHSSLCDTCGNSLVPEMRTARSSAGDPATRGSLCRRTILKILGALPISVLLWWCRPKGLVSPLKRALFSRKLEK